MMLSSYERMRRYISDISSEPLSDSAGLKRELVNWISTVSNSVEQFLDRKLQIAERTEYFAVKYNQREYYPHAYPVIAVPTVSYDPSGLYDGGESDLSDFYISETEDSIVLDTPQQLTGPKALKTIYTGGLAYDGTKSTFIVSLSGTWAATTSYAKGLTSDASGIVKLVGTNTLVVETLFGAFENGETVTSHDDEECANATTKTATIINLYRPALSEIAPDITRGVEIQVRHLWKHKNDFDVTGNSKDGSGQRRIDNAAPVSPFVPEAFQYLYPYQRPVV